jgi:hypothetical protein
MSSFYLQGYFQTLFTCIEKLLGFLNVKNLVLPAAEEVGSIWKNKFGFGAITQDEVCVFVRSIHSSVALMMLLIYCLLTNAYDVVLQLMEYRRRYQIMVFQGALMLQKPVPKCRIVGKSEGG